MKKSKILILFTAIIIPLNLLLYLLIPDGSDALMWVSDLLPVLCSLIAVICMVVAFKSFASFDQTKLSWMLILIGMTLNFLGESTYAFLEIFVQMDMNETFPTLADIFWCNGYLPLITGMMLLFFAYKKSGFPMGNVNLYLIFAIVFVIVVCSVFYYLLIPVMEDDETNVMAKIFYFFYPVADLFLVIPAVLLMYITSLFGTGIISKPLRFLAIGFVCFTVADLLFSVLSWQDLYGNGNPIDLAWNFGYLSIGLAALYQKELIDSFK
jgi:hypothetical protein